MTGFYEKTVSTHFYLPRNLGMLTRDWNMIINDISRNMGNIPMFLDMLNRILEQQIRLACTFAPHFTTRIFFTRINIFQASLEVILNISSFHPQKILR